MSSLVDEFETERGRLRSLAYRMLGTPDDADDIVQEAWLRFAATDQTVESPAAWLTTVVTRLSIDRLRSARVRREEYVGPWLPEPIATEASQADDSVIMAESLSIAFLALMERLSAVERAVFLLHDVFGYSFAEVANMVERTEAAARQACKRARDHIEEGRPRFAPDPENVEALADAFFAAVVGGDLDALGSMLTEQVIHISDGGADHRAARFPVVGRARVARLFTNLAKRIGPGWEVHKVQANGQFGYYFIDGDEPVLLLVSNWVDSRIVSSFAVRNPDKLASFHKAWLDSEGSSGRSPVARLLHQSAITDDSNVAH